MLFLLVGGSGLLNEAVAGDNRRIDNIKSWTTLILLPFFGDVVHWYIFCDSDCTAPSLLVCDKVSE